MVSNGSKETIKLVQQPTREGQDLQPITEISEDTKGKKIDSPIDPNKDIVRQLTTAAEDGDAVSSARILKEIGSDKWGAVSNEMIKMNREDRKKVLDDTEHIRKLPARLSIWYKKDGGEETLKIYQEAELQLQVPLVRVTDKH